ncbi:MAG TPA: PHP domain-containing protein [Methanoregulaceae archaeon]|nr:PHP domain-containing protein [Methanoregulaceae archaeon]
MHIHTRHSDAANSVKTILNHAKKLGIGVSFTDHNDVQAVVEAFEHPADNLVIPGIELSALEGPHILLYFYDANDLIDFFTRHIKANRRRSQYMALQLPVETILEAASRYSCLRVAAHPFGYFGINRGILKCIDNNTLPPQVLDHIDAIEVICGGMSGNLNTMAARYAGSHDYPVTGGSDAHVLPAVGSVVTCVRAGSVEDFLNGILGKEGIVIGSSGGVLHKGMTGAVIAWKYLPYSFSSLQIHYEQNLPRMKNFIRRILK